MSEKEAEVAEGVEPKVEASLEATKFSKEDLDTILGEKDKRIVDLESQLKGIRKLQSEADLELKRFRNQPQSTGNTQLLKELITTIETPQTQDEFGNIKPSPRLAQLKASVARMEIQEKQQQQRQYADAERLKMRKEAEDAGLDPDGEDLALVELAWDNNNPTAARKWLNKAIAKHPKEQKVESKVGKTEEEIRAEVKAELLAKYKIQEIASPSVSSSSFKRIEQDYAEGKISVAVYKKALKEQGL